MIATQVRPLLLLLLLTCLATSTHAEDSCFGNSCAPVTCDGCGSSGLFGSCGSHGSLFGCIQKTDPCYNDFISPITNPVFFEDPRTLTEARFIFLHNEFPNALGGNDAQLFALHLRAAITDRLSIIATKDGFITSDNPLVSDGWADVAAGLKYNLYANPETPALLSTGLVYELPVGSTRALQGTGDGEFNVFLTGAVELIENVHFMSDSGFRLPVNRARESTVWYWSNHLDYQIGDTGLYVLGEANWYHWLRSGRTFPLPVEGLDLANLGSIGVAGNNIVTGALGAKYKPADNMELGLAYEIPLTDRQDILDNRVTFDWIIRY